MTDKKSPAKDDSVWGGPTKRLFVSMLTRDIELSDAILDLIDNCVDGAMRLQRDHLEEDTPFRGFSANLSINKQSFELSDNCGGIPDEFIDDAFSLGRPNIKKDGDIPTIGMYGIGMKRAIFKMGSESIVTSNSEESFFSVNYSSKWLDPENDDDWYLPISKAQKKDSKKGVTISVTQLKEDVARKFHSETFIDYLKKEISQHFGYIMLKGFTIFVNDDQIEPKTLSVFSNADQLDKTINPYDFEVTINDVKVKVVVGFYRPLVKEEEIEIEEERSTGPDSSGISVICNDRVILLADRSAKTGWGDGSVPKYHPQFSAIAGLITFYSNDADKLPISTTKRGLEVGSDVYLVARNAAMEGIKAFTEFTNKWKGRTEETNSFFQNSKATNAKTTVSLAVTSGRQVRGLTDSKRFLPNLPMPDNRNPKRRISFLKNEDDIRTLSKYLFEDPGQRPNLIGEACFDKMLEEAKHHGGK